MKTPQGMGHALQRPVGDRHIELAQLRLGIRGRGTGAPSTREIRRAEARAARKAGVK